MSDAPAASSNASSNASSTGAGAAASSGARRGGRGGHRHRTGLRIVLLVLLAVLVWLLFAGHPLVWAPAVLAAVVFSIDLALAGIDRRARREQRLAAMSPEQRTRTIEAAEKRVGIGTVLTLVIGLGAIALVVAAAFLDWRLVGIGALLVFAWMGLLGLPVWAAAVEEEVEEEHERLTGEERAIR